MGEHGRMPADGDLSARIEAALHSGLDARPVDVGHLATSTRIGIRRARLRRRIAGTGALVAAVAALAVVVATGNGSALGTRTVQPANSGVTPTATSAPRLSRATAADFTFPDSMGLSPSDFPNPRMRLQPVIPPVDPYQPTVFGQTCPLDGKRTAPVPGQLESRLWGWDEGDTSLPTQQLRVQITATLWKAGTGQKHFDEILTNTGFCHWRVGVPRAASTGSLPGTSWVATRLSESAEAAMLVGDVIVSVDVADPNGHASALQVARRLLALSVGRLEAASLVVTSSSTCTPACQTGPTKTCTGACAAYAMPSFYGDWRQHRAAIHFDRNGTGSAQIALEVAKGGQDESDAFALSLSPDGSELTLRVTSVSWWLNGVGSTRLTKPSPQDTTPSAPGDRYQVRFTAPGLLRISAVQGSGALDGLVLCGKSVSAPVRVHACGA